MTVITHSRQGLVSSITGFAITLFLLYLLSLSHQFLTRRSESQTRISLGPVGSSVEAKDVKSREAALPMFQSELQALQANPTVSDYSLQDFEISQTQVDWAMSQPADIGTMSDLTTASIDGLPGGIAPPMESTPNALYIPPAKFPVKLIQAGIVSGSALIHMRIDKSGHCHVLNVVEISDAGLQEVIVQAVEKSIFQVTRVNGQAREREVLFPVRFQANEERVRVILSKIGKR